MKINKPTLLLDEAICRRNIERMAMKADKSGVGFRPHFKTHRSAEVGNWFRDFGVRAITVSSVSMAAYFARHGWEDITIAFPVNILEINNINKLTSKIKLNLLVESTEAVHALGRHIRNPVGIFIEVDAGYHRTGIPWDDIPAISALVRHIRSYPLLMLKGLLTHSGNTYHAGGLTEIRSIYTETRDRLRWVTQTIPLPGNDQLAISIGDTPSCSVIERFEGVDEIRPGNFVFYDLMQYQLGASSLQEIALIMACPVIAVYPQRQEIVIYGGAVHFSRDYILTGDSDKNYGQPVIITENGWKFPEQPCYLASLSQEHGIIKYHPGLFDLFRRGMIIGVIPVHACLAVSCSGSMQTRDGRTLTIA